MLFESIHLRNFLSFGPDSQPVTLGPLNVLVGPNGSGKSNFIEGIAFLRNCTSGRPVVSQVGSTVNDFIWKGDSSLDAAQLNFVFCDSFSPVVSYGISFSSDHRGLVIRDEEIKVSYGDSYVRSRDDKNIPYRSLDRSILSGRIDTPFEIDFLIDGLSILKVYKDWVFGRNSPVRLPQPPDGAADALEEDCSNLGMVLSQIKEDRKLRAAFIEHVRDLYPTIIDFDVRILPGFVQVTLEEEHVGRIPATRLSDGTLRYLCLLAILLNPTPPPLVCIEEPELGLHPDVQNRLARLMREASERMQIIVTTHSEAFVDALTDTPEALMVCERHNGSTVIERVDPERFAVWLQDHSLGELWRGGYIGGNRW